MKYQFIYSVRALKELEKLDLYTKRMIKSWIEKNLIDCEDPRIHGKALTANRKGEWRYRIGDYRLICLIKDNELVVLAVNVGHRKNFYT